MAAQEQPARDPRVDDYIAKLPADYSAWTARQLRGISGGIVVGRVRRIWCVAAALSGVAAAAVAVSDPGVAAGTHAAPVPTSISGRIVDDHGHPLAGVVVSAMAAVGFVGYHSVRTGHDGRYLLATDPGPQWMYLDGSHARGGRSDGTGYFGHRTDVVVARYRHTTEHVDATMHPGGAVRGRVTDAEGNPLTGVTATLRTTVPYVSTEYDYDTLDPAPGASAPLSHDGRFVITGAAPGAYQLCLDTSSHVTGGVSDRRGYEPSCGSTIVAAASGTVTMADPIALGSATGSAVSGRAVDRDGRPVDGVIVELRNKHAYYYGYTDRHGRWRMNDVTANSYRVCFTTFLLTSRTRTGYAPGCAKNPLAVDGHSIYRVDRTMARGAAIAGHVRGANGKPVAGVTLWGDWNQVYGDEVLSETTDTGRYIVKNLPAHGANVCFFPDFSAAVGPGNPTGGVSSDCVGARTRFGHVSTVRDTHLTAAGGVSGVVRGTNGRPIPNVEIDLEGNGAYGNDGEFYAYTDARGHYTAVDLPPGKYQVCFSNYVFYEKCYPNTGFAHAATLHVRANTITPHIDATLQSHHNTLRVVAEDANGHRLAGVDAVLFRGCKKSDGDCLRQRLAGARRQVYTSDMTNGHGQVTWHALAARKYQLCLYGYYGTRLDGAPSTGYQDTCQSGMLSITVDKSTNRTIVVHLHDAGAISGRVTDQDGNPRQYVRVHVPGAADDFADDGYGSEAPSPRWDAYTDANGEFTVRSVTPGDQPVCFDPQRATGGTYQPQCYGAAPGSTSGGTPVSVVRDQVTPGIDIALTPGPAPKRAAVRPAPTCRPPALAPPATHRTPGAPRSPVPVPVPSHQIGCTVRTGPVN